MTLTRLFSRYFVLELAPPGEKAATRLDISEDALYRAVLEVVSQIHGDYGVSAVRTRLIGTCTSPTWFCQFTV